MKSPGKKIMILDDDRPCTQLISDFLTDAGYEVHAFNDPGEAWEKLPAVKPDCLILDLNMPLFDGREFIPWARKTFPQLVIIICSGLNIHDDRAIKDYQIRHIIQKPVNGGQILKTVQKALSETI